MKKRTLIGLSILFIVLLVSGCGKEARLRRQNNQLLEEISLLEEEIEELKGNQSEKGEDFENAWENADSTTYINIKFWLDGKYYKIEEEDFVFYEDPYCSIPAKERQIISPQVDEVQLKNGNLVFAVRAVEDGETIILWSTKYPFLETVEDDEQ